MKIVDRRKYVPVPFGNLPIGAVFEYHNDFHMKFADEGFDNNCICLSTGLLYSLLINEKVTPASAVLTINN